MAWFFSAGDGPFYFAETIRQLGWFPVIWRADEGFGANHGFRLWYDYALQLIIKIFSAIGFNWWWIDKFLWIGAIALAIYTSYTLGKYFLKKPYAYLVPVVYVFNTYFLLLFSGGQLGVTWAYAYFPFVLVQFIRVIDENRGFDLSGATRRGLALALLITFDLRFSYLLLAALALYFLFTRKVHKILESLVSILIALGIHAFWILPTLVVGGAGVGVLDNEITNPGMLHFLSFADFSHALSLLHPNWPENLFGKVYFLQPEFLVIPVLAFASLLFIKAKTLGKQMFFFALLAITGIFFAKGVNDPFGGVYTWVFTHIPGFVMFRDPTKFYVYIAVGYSILIPLVLERIDKKIVLLVFVTFWIFTIRALFMGEMRGNFHPLQLPQEYVQLKNLLVADSVPSRTLWIPQQEKFAYTSDTHPLLYADQLFPGASFSAIASIAGTPNFVKTLSASGVGYVVVPEDLEKRLFLNDYRFDPEERRLLIDALKKTPFVMDASFHNVAVFKTNEFIFESKLPASFARQQALTDIGLVISVIVLILAICILFFR